MIVSPELSAESPQRRREPSMEDVARAAGVSGQTVSRVVNARGYVGAATRTRVEEAMQQLGYRPNSAARALRSGRFRAIGVVMFSFSSYGNQRTLDAIAVRAAQAGYALTLIPIESSATETVAGAFRRLEEHAVDWLRQVVGLSGGWFGIVSDTACISTMLALAAADIGRQPHFEREHHVDERLKGDADEERADHINDMAVLERGRERRDPLFLGAPRLEIAATELLHPEQPDRMEQQPQR